MCGTQSKNGATMTIGSVGRAGAGGLFVRGEFRIAVSVLVSKPTQLCLCSVNGVNAAVNVASKLLYILMNAINWWSNGRHDFWSVTFKAREKIVSYVIM